MRKKKLIQKKGGKEMLEQIVIYNSNDKWIILKYDFNVHKIDDGWSDIEESQ